MLNNIEKLEKDNIRNISCMKEAEYNRLINDRIFMANLNFPFLYLNEEYVVFDVYNVENNTKESYYITREQFESFKYGAL